MAASPTLASRIPAKAISGSDTSSKTNRHCLIPSSAANAPNAARTIAGCGPESPSAKGRGGNNDAPAKNNHNQRCGSASVHHKTGNSNNGDDRSNPYSGFGINATPDP